MANLIKDKVQINQRRQKYEYSYKWNSALEYSQMMSLRRNLTLQSLQWNNQEILLLPE